MEAGEKIGSFHETAKVVHSLRISTAGITMKAELGLSGIVPSMMSDANQEEAIEAASASMGDHERADSVLGAKSAWPGGVCDGVVGSWRWGISASDALAGNEGPWEVSWTCWMNSATPSASTAAPVKSSIGAFPWRLPLLSRRWLWENRIRFQVSWGICPLALLREGRMHALTRSTSEAACTRVSSCSQTTA